MIMTGINGKNNNLKDSIVLYDSSIELSELEEIQNKLNIKIISLDHQSSEILQTNNFSYSISDDFLDDIERKIFKILHSNYPIGLMMKNF